MAVAHRPAALLLPADTPTCRPTSPPSSTKRGKTAAPSPTPPPVPCARLWMPRSPPSTPARCASPSRWTAAGRSTSGSRRPCFCPSGSTTWRRSPAARTARRGSTRCRPSSSAGPTNGFARPDSARWSTVGSCAQIGRACHISGGAGIGGVLEPLQADPVIIEDNCFVGARAEVAEGVLVPVGQGDQVDAVEAQPEREAEALADAPAHRARSAGPHQTTA